MELKNTHVIVTGGASGLGAGAAELLASDGAKVSILDMNEETGKAHAAKIGGKFFKVNVADAASVTEALDAAIAANGVARVLVNCAGIVHGGKTVGGKGELKPHPLDAFQRVINVNLIGTFNMISQFAAKTAMADPVGEERGVIINTASVAAYDGQIGQAAYSASKGGIVGMTLPIARDLSQYGIRVMTVAPGLFMTPMMASLPKEVQDSLGKMTPFPSRLGTPAEFALLIKSIILNVMLNGEVIRIDGAVRLTPR